MRRRRQRPTTLMLRIPPLQAEAQRVDWPVRILAMTTLRERVRTQWRHSKRQRRDGAAATVVAAAIAMCCVRMAVALWQRAGPRVRLVVWKAMARLQLAAAIPAPGCRCHCCRRRRDRRASSWWLLVGVALATGLTVHRKNSIAMQTVHERSAFAAEAPRSVALPRFEWRRDGRRRTRTLASRDGIGRNSTRQPQFRAARHSAAVDAILASGRSDSGGRSTGNGRWPDHGDAGRDGSARTQTDGDPSARPRSACERPSKSRAGRSHGSIVDDERGAETVGRDRPIRPGPGSPQRLPLRSNKETPQ